MHLVNSGILLFLKALQKEENDLKFLLRMQGVPISCQRSVSHIMSNVTVCVRITQSLITQSLVYVTVVC